MIFFWIEYKEIDGKVSEKFHFQVDSSIQMANDFFDVNLRAFFGRILNNTGDWFGIELDFIKGS